MTMLKRTWELKVQDWYVDSVTIEARVDSITSLWVYKDGEFTFDVILPIQELVKVDYGETYSKVQIPEEWNMWIYNGGIWIAQDWNIILYISKSWSLYSVIWLIWEYEYDRELKANKLTLYQGSDLNKTSPITVWLRVEPYKS